MIRLFKEEDLPKCKEIIENCLTYSFKDTPKFIKFFKEEFNDSDYFKLKSEIRGIFVFEEKNIIKGMGCADGNWIRKVFVEPRYQKKEIGTKIVQYLEKVIKENGYDKIFIYSYPFTKELCLKKGYNIIEEKVFERDKFRIIGIKMVKKI